MADPKTPVPPVADLADVNAAMILLRRWQKQLAELPAELRTWVVQTLAATMETKE